MYMDHHDKFGLSPINVDRVDLDRFPDFSTGRMYHARLEAGDALYIPDRYRLRLVESVAYSCPEVVVGRRPRFVSPRRRHGPNIDPARS